MESPKNLKTAAIGLAIMAVSLVTACFLLREKVDITRNRAVQSGHTVKTPLNINWVPARLATEEARKAGKPIFCFFTVENNKACRELENLLLADSKIRDSLNQSFIPVLIVYFDSLPDSAQEKRVCRHYGVAEFPTLLVTDPEGKKLAEQSGLISKERAAGFLAANMRLKSVSAKKK